MRDPPSAEEVDRAIRNAESQFVNLDLVTEQVLSHFKRKCALYDFHIMPEGENNFRAWVFFDTDAHLEEYTKSKFIETIKDFVFAAMERAGRGSRHEIGIVFEFDSNQNVNKQYHGNYYNRLR